MNASSDDEGNNDEDSPETPYEGEILMLILIMREIMMRFPLTHL